MKKSTQEGVMREFAITLNEVQMSPGKLRFQEARSL